MRRRRRQRVAQALIVSPPEHTRIDPSTGAVTSIQSADLVMPDEALDAIWTPMHLERLARTYWRFLSRVTLHIIQVKYREDGRDVKLFGLIPLLTFEKPEYEMDGTRGIVRWRIEKGILVAKAGRGGRGYLEIEVERRDSPDTPECEIAHVEVEVANFYPAIAAGIGRWFYENTQSRIHVLVTHGFLRSLAKLDLVESKVGRFARIEDLPDPVREREAV
ncbi:MAG TPA: hypothetical protein VF549_10570 [Solirubrobacteraceae bacterium]